MWVHQCIRYFYMLLQDYGDLDVFLEIDGKKIPFSLWDYKIYKEDNKLIIRIRDEEKK